MSARRLLTTGSRDWPDPVLVHTTLTTWWVEHGFPTDVELVQGECPFGGADWDAAETWRGLGLPVLGVPMRPRDCDTGCYHRRPATPGKCPRSGPERNQEMVDLPGIVEAFAFPLPGSRGTADCIRRIRAAGIPLTTVEPTTLTPACRCR